MADRRQKGLTLVETLVALAILSAVVIAAFAMIAQSARFAAFEQERLIAGIVADNIAAEILLRATPPPEGVEERPVVAAGRDWIASVAVTEASAELLRVEIVVMRSTGGQPLAKIDTLRARE